MSSDSGAGKISFLQLSMIFLLSNGLISHVVINPMLLESSGRDAWLVPLVSILPAIAWYSAVYFIMRRTAQANLQSWLASRTSPFASRLLLFPVYVHVYMIGAIELIHTGNWTATNYLPETPKTALILLLLVISCIASAYGIRAIAIGSGVLLPIVFLLGYFVAISNTRLKDYKLLMPVLEHGWSPVFDGLVYAVGGLSEVTLLVLLQHRLKNKVKWWHLLVLVLLLIQIMLGPIVGAITEFGPTEASRQSESPFEQWRLVQIGPFIEHVDFLSVHQWLSGSTVRISLAMYLLSEFLGGTANSKRRRWIVIACALSYFALTFIPMNQLELYQFKLKYFIPGALIVELCVTVVWLIAAVILKPGKERTT